MGQPLGKLLGRAVDLKMNMPGDVGMFLLGVNPKGNVFTCTQRCFDGCSDSSSHSCRTLELVSVLVSSRVDELHHGENVSLLQQRGGTSYPWHSEKEAR